MLILLFTLVYSRSTGKKRRRQEVRSEGWARAQGLCRLWKGLWVRFQGLCVGAMGRVRVESCHVLNILLRLSVRIDHGRKVGGSRKVRGLLQLSREEVRGLY